MESNTQNKKQAQIYSKYISLRRKVENKTATEKEKYEYLAWKFLANSFYGKYVG